jgi:hypothetical protein
MKKTILIIIAVATIFAGCKKETPQPQKQQCEISNTGIFKVVNKTPYSITVKIDGGTPSNMGYLTPDQEASVEVTAANSHSIHINTTTGSSANLVWDYQQSVGACQTSQLNITL